MALVNLAWAGVESMRYHLQLERRLRLALADPVVSDRLRLWALGMLAAASITLIDMMLVELHGGGLATTPLGGWVLGLLGTTASAAIWLAFLPPRAYTNWVTARAGS